MGFLRTEGVCLSGAAPRCCIPILVLAEPKLGRVMPSLPPAPADPQRSETKPRPARSVSVVLHHGRLSAGLAMGRGLLCSGVVYPATAQDCCIIIYYILIRS